MIRLAKKPSVPPTLRSTEVQDILARIKQKIAQKEDISDQDFKSRLWRKDDVRGTLWKYQSKKCCYCERIRDEKREPDIEHFRPKTATKEDGKPDYWWLAYCWENLFFSCKTCNQTKSHQFPLSRGNRVRDESGDLSTEFPILPHPVDEDPEDFITFRWDDGPPPISLALGKDDEGRGTCSIRILGIDRKPLREERGRSLVTFRGIAAKMHHFEHANNKQLIQRTAKEIADLTTSSNPFAGFARAFFRANGLAQYISID